MKRGLKYYDSTDCDTLGRAIEFPKYPTPKDKEE
jgi:hypothetical protein